MGGEKTLHRGDHSILRIFDVLRVAYVSAAGGPEGVMGSSADRKFAAWWKRHTEIKPPHRAHAVDTIKVPSWKEPCPAHLGSDQAHRTAGLLQQPDQICANQLHSSAIQPD